MQQRFAAAIVMLLSLNGAARASDWTEFRGPARTGVSSETGVPVAWSRGEGVRWKAALPGPGNSSPVVVAGQVLVTCASDDGRRRGLYAFDRREGRPLWNQVVEYDHEDPTHPTNPYCGSSPAADRQRVVVWHGSAGVHCYGPDGRELWKRDLGTFRHIWGYGSSPVLHGDRVFLNCGPGPRQFVIALDAATGKILWQADEPGGDTGEEEQGKDATKPLWVGSWSTPVLATVEGREQLIVALPHHVKGYDPASGAVLWQCDGLGDLVYTDPLIREEICIVMGGFHGPAMGFRLGGSGNITEKNRLWLNKSRNPQRIGSGVITGEHVFVVNEIGLAQCLELKTGRELWKDRLAGKFWSSLLLAEGRLYATNQEGTTYVFAPRGDELEILETNEIGEHTNATLALSDGQVFQRTFEHLFCIEQRSPR